MGRHVMGWDRSKDEWRWDCQGGQNCFAQKKRLKFSAFRELKCLPREGSFSDMDAITEIGGRGLLQEWKPPGFALPEAQRKLLLRLTEGKLLTGFFVWGNAEHMTAEGYWVFWNGKQHPYIEADFEALCLRIEGWAKWSEDNSLLEDRRAV